MYILTITYPRTADSTFDFDYYRATHLPMVGKAFGGYGLGYASVLRGEEGVDGTPPATHAIEILSFRDEQGARDALASRDAAEVTADFAKFASVPPLMQFNTAVP